MNIKDQGEWERCTSSRRMFMALLGPNNKTLSKVSVGLLCMARKRMPYSRKVRAAQDYWNDGMRDENNKEQAERTYLVIRHIVEAVDEMPDKAWAGGGEVLVCSAIRALLPLAPGGFSGVGDKVGGLAAMPSARILPVRIRVGH